ncbi:hypothetical protein RvY_15370 [Ramazzottius varieornatus]|uniref:Mitochondrial import inner membrane translocase subunit n=1 Tax=Ramazzottius varieornatus TaxID=947166 RepID=A0A1D1VUQ5_RAMVA|nr:hypothetical protein RvY_15370 [Ramazzottius varieornatus]
MDTEGAARNFKDFMQMYNQLTERCFGVCVADLGTRRLTEPEEQCVSNCATKNVRLNNRTMEVFMELQPAILEKRQREAMEAMAKAEAAQATSQSIGDNQATKDLT